MALDRLELERQPVEVLLGGGLLRAGDARLLGAIVAGLARVGDGIGCMRRARRPSSERRCSGSTAWPRATRRRTRIRSELAAAVDADARPSRRPLLEASRG